MYCKDCKFRVKGWCESKKLVESDEQDGGSDQLVYCYTEGGGFEPDDYFGCVHFKEQSK